MIFLLRMIALGVLAILWLIVGLVVCLSRPKHKHNTFILTQCLRVAQKVIGVKVHYNFDLKDAIKHTPAIVVANHQTNWDIVTLANLYLPGTICVGKKSLLYAPIFGILFYLSGNILIDRDNKQKTGDNFLKIINKIKNKGQSLWIFPEGHRSLGKPIQSFKSGAAHIAINAQLPIIPFVVSSYYSQIKLNRWNNGDIYVDLLPIIETEGLDKMKVRSITKKLREDMIAKQVELDAINRANSKIPLDTQATNDE